LDRRLVRGVPLTHCVLLIEDRATGVFVPRRAATATGEHVEGQPLLADSAVVPGLPGPRPWQVAHQY
jgi:hypothetical protein